MNFRTEFPDYPADDMPTMPEGFTDESWHNDTCPCWARGDLTIWCDYIDTAKREWDDGPRSRTPRIGAPRSAPPRA